MKKIGSAILIVILVLMISLIFFKSELENVLFSGLVRVDQIMSSQSQDDNFRPTQSNQPNSSSTDETPQVIARNLDIPWEIVFLPDDTMLVTQRPGTLLHLYPHDQKTIEVSGVIHKGEGGLLGMALHPQFFTNRFVYLYETTSENGQLVNRVSRYRFDGDVNTLSDRTTIIDGIAGANNHDGGRIAFGPDGLLYITTGDAQNEANAQDQNTLAGKILRLNDDGTIPSDNPFGNAVFSYGHRNPQGLAWDSQEKLWATEHGPSGIRSGFDEINLITKGNNYGWPTIQGDETQEGLISPVIQSGSTDTWAPAAIEIIDDTVFFVGLRGESVYTAVIVGTQLTEFKPHWTSRYGRLRLIKQGPDGMLYIATSNTDGRGKPQADDDKLIRVDPQVFLR